MLAYEQQIAEHNVQKILISAITFIIALPVRLKVSFRGGKNEKKIRCDYEKAAKSSVNTTNKMN